MRKAQCAYFVARLHGNPAHEDLAKAKQLESRVDNEVRRMLRPSPQRDLGF